MKAVVTGAAGFIGRELCRQLRSRDWEVCGLTRSESAGCLAVGDLSAASETDLRSCLEGADLVFNLAGRAHRADAGRDARLADAYRRDNVLVAERLYNASADVGVGRFVQMSTIKVLGDVAPAPLAATAAAAPADVYSETKWQAEQRLRTLSRSGIPTTVVRVPLVYGPGVAGNFARLIALVRRGWAIPLGAARAQRSLVYVKSLCELLGRLGSDDSRFRIVHAGGHDVCVAQLVEQIAAGLGTKARLIAVPKRLMAVAFRTAGAGSTFRSLFEPLLVDDAETRERFDWWPNVDVSTAVAATVSAWHAR